MIQISEDKKPGRDDKLVSKVLDELTISSMKVLSNRIKSGMLVQGQYSSFVPKKKEGDGEKRVEVDGES
jgi:hypothetical protein